MKHVMPVLTTSLLLAAATAGFGQVTPPPADKEHKEPTETRARTQTKTDADVTYGRVKELTAGDKIVIDIDNAPDKSFDLTSKDVTVNIAKNLKVGDTVKVAEQSALGKTKSVVITKHAGGGVTHGDKDPAKTP